MGPADRSPARQRLIAALAAGTTTPTPQLGRSALSTLIGPPSATQPRPLGLAAFFTARIPPNPAGTIIGRALFKRKCYFAFDFDDLMRTNNVRQSWKIHHPHSEENRSFYDRSIWESRNIRDSETLKRLMRTHVKYSSAVCVLVGTDTWRSRWVKYEISRAVVDERGLLAVHINGLNHVERRAPDPLGYNPLEVMGIYRSVLDRYYLYEKHVTVDPTSSELGWAWRQYQDYTDPVPVPRYMPAVAVNHVMPLARATAAYDYVAGIGHRNIGTWIDRAAVAAGR